MKKSHKKLPAGEADWGISLMSGKGYVELAVTGPQGGYYPCDVMTPDQADEIALELTRKAQDARDKGAK